MGNDKILCYYSVRIRRKMILYLGWKPHHIRLVLVGSLITWIKMLFYCHSWILVEKRNLCKVSFFLEINFYPRKWVNKKKKIIRILRRTTKENLDTIISKMTMVNGNGENQKRTDTETFMFITWLGTRDLTFRKWVLFQRWTCAKYVVWISIFSFHPAEFIQFAFFAYSYHK